MLSMETRQLIERCRRGDADALGQLYTAYAQRMRGVCRRYVSDAQGVDDVLHDAFVIIFTSFDRLRDDRRAEAWMMAITRNVASKYKEQLAGRQFVPLDEAMMMTDEEADDVRGVPLDEVMTLVDKLPEGYGKVFRLSVFEGMSHKEIAAALGIEAHSSSSQLARAKRMLRRMMQQYWALLLLLVPLTMFLLRREDAADEDAPAIAERAFLPKQEEQATYPSARPKRRPTVVHISIHTTPQSTLAAAVAQAQDSLTPDTLPPMLAQEQSVSDTIRQGEQADATRFGGRSVLPHYDFAVIFPDEGAKSPRGNGRWSVDFACAGGLGGQSANRPFSFTETPTLAISGEPPSPVTFERWSDYAAFLSEEPDVDGDRKRDVLMNIALSNAGAGTDEIVRRSHHYAPFSFTLALKYRLTGRFGLETGVSYSRLRSEFETGSGGNAIREEQTVHYIGIPVKGTYNIYKAQAWNLYGSLGVSAEIPVYAPLQTNYYLRGALQASDKSSVRAPWQWSVGAGLGVHYSITPRLGFFAEPSLRYYIPPAGSVETYRTAHPFSFSLPLGLRFTW